MKTYNIVVHDHDIHEVLNKCAESEDEGVSTFTGMTYEQGMTAMFNWLIGNSNINPLE